MKKANGLWRNPARARIKSLNFHETQNECCHAVDLAGLGSTMDQD